MPANTSGDLTTTGSVSLTKPITDTIVNVALSGTYGTVTFVLEANIDGTNWFPIFAVRADTMAVVTGTISPTDDTERMWRVDGTGIAQVRARVTAISTGTATFTLQSASYVGIPFSVNSTTTGTSLAAQTFTGDVTLSGGSDLIMSGTTGQSEIILTDNLADALSIKISGGNDFMSFTSTDAGETINIASDLTFADAKNIVVNATTGTKIGTATTQKIGMWNVTPVVQPVANTDTTTGAAGGTTAVYLNTTFVGPSGSSAYTIGGIVKALKAVGIIAA